MTVSGTEKIVNELVAAYPNIVKTSSKQDFGTLWFKVLENVDDSEAEDAVMFYMRSEDKGFYPTPGKIMDIIRHNRGTEKTDEVNFNKHMVYEDAEGRIWYNQQITYFSGRDPAHPGIRLTPSNLDAREGFRKVYVPFTREEMAELKRQKGYTDDQLQLHIDNVRAGYKSNQTKPAKNLDEIIGKVVKYA